MQAINNVFQLGGKNAGIVFADADLSKCIPTTIRLVNIHARSGEFSESQTLALAFQYTCICSM